MAGRAGQGVAKLGRAELGAAGRRREKCRPTTRALPAAGPETPRKTAKGHERHTRHALHRVALWWRGARWVAAERKSRM